jgi:hypothetical protein
MTPALQAGTFTKPLIISKNPWQIAKTRNADAKVVRALPCCGYRPTARGTTIHFSCTFIEQGHRCEALPLLGFVAQW